MFVAGIVASVFCVFCVFRVVGVVGVGTACACGKSLILSTRFIMLFRRTLTTSNKIAFSDRFEARIRHYLIRGLSEIDTKNATIWRDS